MNSFYSDVSYKFASGGMIGSVEDLVKLGRALNQGLLLSAEARRLMLSSQGEGLRQFVEGAPSRGLTFSPAMLWRLRRDPDGLLVAYGCGSVKGFNACLVDFLEEDLVAALATNSWRCCGWKNADALAGFFRPTSSGRSPASGSN